MLTRFLVQLIRLRMTFGIIRGETAGFLMRMNGPSAHCQNLPTERVSLEKLSIISTSDGFSLAQNHARCHNWAGVERQLIECRHVIYFFSVFYWSCLLRRGKRKRSKECCELISFGIGGSQGHPRMCASEY